MRMQEILGQNAQSCGTNTTLDNNAVCDLDTDYKNELLTFKRIEQQREADKDYKKHQDACSNFDGMPLVG